MPVIVNTTSPWGISCILSARQHTAEFEGLSFRAYPRISAWKSSFCPGRPREHWALPNRDCITAGNFWFCFVHRSRRITSSETHLTRLSPLGCPLLNPYGGLHLPAIWEIQQWRDSLVLLCQGCSQGIGFYQQWDPLAFHSNCKLGSRCESFRVNPQGLACS